MILNQDIIDVLKETALGKGNELWITDAIKKYVQNGGIFLAKEIEDGEWLTTGDPLNYLKAASCLCGGKKRYRPRIERIHAEIVLLILKSPLVPLCEGEPGSLPFERESWRGFNYAHCHQCR